MVDRLVETPEYHVFEPGTVELFHPSARTIFQDFNARAKRSGWEVNYKDEEWDDRSVSCTRMISIHCLWQQQQKHNGVAVFQQYAKNLRPTISL
jgi:hypothetical protein